MKIFFYTLRPWDERPFAERLAAETGIEFDGCEAYPSLENAHLAAGCDAVSMTPCDMGPAMVRRFHELGVKYLCCRSIGYDHVDRETARALGMRVSNVDYPPRGVANFAIMLMLMSLRRVGHILKRGEVQDYSLQGKIGRDLSGCTVGVIGTTSTPARRPRNMPGTSTSTPSAPRATSSPCTPMPRPKTIT